MGLFDIFNTDAQDAAAASQKAGINAGLTGATDLLGKGRDALTTNYAAALDPFKSALAQTTGTGARGYDAYADASGANGPEGLARAKANFTATPGYTEGLNMGLDQNDRRAAARGMLASGNTQADTIKFATDYGNTKYGDYVGRLAPFTSNPSQTAGVASGMANVSTGLGSQLNQSFGNQADVFNKAQLGIGNANANADLANLTASQNMWGALMQGGKLLAGAATGMPSMPSFGGPAGGAGSGNASGEWGAFTMSDERLKDDIEQVGELFDGQPVYRYSYKGDDTTHIGLIAQEVEEIAPDAVTEFGGFKAVDYGKATDYAAELWQEAA